MPRTYSDGYDKNNNPVERLLPTVTQGTLGYMLNSLQDSASEYRVHYRVTNPFDEDIEAAKVRCKAMLPLRADFGAEIKRWIDTVVEASWAIGYPVMAPNVLVGMYGVAVQCASESYTPQLALVQATYGCLDSSSSKIPHR